MSYAQLILGDCLKAMPRHIKDHSIDLILADLPYGVTKNKWDRPLDLGALWEEYRRVAKADAPIILTATNPFAADLINSNRSMFKYDWVWIKPPVSPLNAKKRPMPAHELVLVFYNKMPTYNPQGLRHLRRFRSERDVSKSKNYGKTGSKAHVQEATNYPTTVFSVKNLAQPQKEHPTQKPVEAMEYLIKTYSGPGDTVLDNCMGSGTTGLAAIRIGRNFIGIEKDPDYFAIAEKRLGEHRSASSWLEGTDKCQIKTTGKSSSTDSPGSSSKVSRAVMNRPTA